MWGDNKRTGNITELDDLDENHLQLDSHRDETKDSDIMHFFWTQIREEKANRYEDTSILLGTWYIITGEKSTNVASHQGQ